MSLACFECQRGGSFNTQIIFDPNGVFDENKHTAQFRNFYTDCAKAEDFSEAISSRFAIVTRSGFDDSWFTGDDGPELGTVSWKRIPEQEIAGKLPRIYGALLRSSVLA